MAPLRQLFSRRFAACAMSHGLVFWAAVSVAQLLPYGFWFGCLGSQPYLGYASLMGCDGSFGFSATVYVLGSSRLRCLTTQSS
jgi:hypothetical protein